MTRRLSVVLALLLPVLAAADERILSYGVDISVRQDGWIDVVETIVVDALGDQIRRGICRDFPTSYRDRFRNDVEVDYVPGFVLRNGEPEDLFSRDYLNGVRTCFGHKDRMLAAGVHTYEYHYRANRMLGFFDEFDEFYWTAIGHDWDFPIDSASVAVTLEFDGSPEILEANVYTGRFGGQGAAATSQVDGRTANFRSTRGFVPGEGMTVAVNWPKGFVTEPDTMQEVVWLLTDNRNLLVALAGLGLMLAYLIPVWRAFGRDPEEGLIVTTYEPPEGFSPASLRYIHQMYYDNKVMTSAVVNLAVKGYLQIEDDDGTHTLRKSEPGSEPPPLATGEAALYDGLFADGDSLVLENEEHARIRSARKAHRDSLRADYRGRYFRTNGLKSLPALGIGAVAAVIALNVGSGPSVAVIAVILAMIAAFVVFTFLMRQPTALGRQVLDEMLGFRDYLDLAEKEELNLRNPPEKTPRLFETYLPFALAMGVEQHWAERFASVFATIGDPQKGAYQPSWYSGSSWNSFDMGHTASGLSSSLGSSISSSATPPGSSSGSGGGGFSGGGGGGGGGGGW